MTKKSKSVAKVDPEKAIFSNSTRKQIVDTLIHLRKGKGLYVKELLDMKEFKGMEPSLFSHHLSTLRLAGVLASKRDGKKVSYSINYAADFIRGRTFNFKNCSLRWK